MFVLWLNVRSPIININQIILQNCQTLLKSDKAGMTTDTGSIPAKYRDVIYII